MCTDTHNFKSVHTYTMKKRFIEPYGRGEKNPDSNFCQVCKFRNGKVIPFTIWEGEKNPDSNFCQVCKCRNGKVIPFTFSGLLKISLHCWIAPFLSGRSGI